MNDTGTSSSISAETVPAPTRSVSEREMMALNALAGIYGSDYDCLGFKAIARRSGLDPAHVRRSVRALARKGLAEYAKGLWTDDGELAGSGYRCTAAGLKAATNPIQEYCA
jgi:DNA-binding IclR family transcriptional regulator